jgi:hypothetical protein
MTVITLIVGSVGLCAVGVAAWYAAWRLRLASKLERVPVRSGRSVPVPRDGVEPGSNPE